MLLGEFALRYIVFFIFALLFSIAAHADPITIGLGVASIAGAAAAAAAPTILAGSIFATTIGAAVFGGLVTATLGFVASTVFKPKAPKFDFSSYQNGVTLQTRTADEPHKIIYGTARVGGNLSFMQTESSGFRSDGSAKSGDNPFLHLMVSIAGHELEEITAVYFDDQALTLDGSGFVTSAPFFRDGFSYARIIKHLGTTTQAADSVALARVSGWDSNFQGRGIAYLHVILEFNTDIFINGVPNISALVKGRKVYDPRSSTTAWSNNPALCVRDYLTADFGFAVPSSRIDNVSFSDIADLCDEAVTKKDGSTHARFTCDGVLSMEQSAINNLDILTSSLLAPVTYSQGKFRCHAAAYNIPVLDVTDDMLAGPIKIVPRMERKDLFNAVKGGFVDASNLHTPTSFPTVLNATYEAEDGGTRIEKEVNFPMQIDPERCQRMAKIILEKARQSIMIDMHLNISGMQLAVFDVITRTDADFGWVNKEFRIVHWEFEPTSGVKIMAQEENSASYDWNSGEATIYDSAPNTNLANPFSVSAPGAPSAVESLYSTIESGGVKAKAVVSWSPSSDSFTDSYVLEYKLTTDSDYIVLPRTIDTSFTIFDVKPGNYNFRVRAQNSVGVLSDYASSVIALYGLSAPPANVAGFSLNQIHNNAHLSWDLATDLDVRIGGTVRLRYTPLTTGASWSAAVDITSALAGVATHAVVPLLAGTYMAKFLDSTGTESTAAAEITSSVANIVPLNAILTRDEHPTFSGAKTNMTVASSNLKLTGAGPFSTSGVYEFASYLDVGVVTTSRISMEMQATVANGNDTFDERPGLFDDAAGRFDGEDVTGIDVYFYVSSTSDDPAGLPTWSPWRKVIVGDYTARAFKFKIEVASSDDALNISISSLSAVVDVPDLTDSGVITTSSSAATSVTFNKVFTTTAVAGGTMQNAQTGDFITITGTTITGFTLNAYNSGGTRIVRNVKWEAHGY